MAAPAGPPAACVGRCACACIGFRASAGDAEQCSACGHPQQQHAYAEPPAFIRLNDAIARLNRVFFMDDVWTPGVFWYGGGLSALRAYQHERIARDMLRWKTTKDREIKGWMVFRLGEKGFSTQMMRGRVPLLMQEQRTISRRWMKFGVLCTAGPMLFGWLRRQNTQPQLLYGYGSDERFY